MSNENRLPAETKPGDFTKCCICFNWFKTIQWHHTIPQSHGGVDSLQIPLCGGCHNTLHSKSEAIVSYLVGNRKEPVGNYWDKEESERRADPWVKIVVEALLEPPIESSDKLIRLGSPKVDLETRAELDLLKQDLPGVTNLMQVQLYCLHYTLQNKGYKDGKINQHSSTSQRNTNRASDLWAVRGTKRGKFDQRRR